MSAQVAASTPAFERAGDRAAFPACDVLDELASAANRLLELDRLQNPSIHRAAAGLHDLAAAIEACEAAGFGREALVEKLAPVRALFARSPFVHRLQTWPRGYAGDFETVEWICEGANRAEPHSVAWVLEQCSLQSPVAQQHRNKVLVQADAIRSALSRRPSPRIASIGCGGCRDLRLAAPCVSDDSARFVLIDADPDALAFAEARLGAIAGRCTFVHGRVPRVLARLAPGPAFDLVIAGGLFDYLLDRWAVDTLRRCRTLLRPGGELLFSNIASGNPYRLWIEYLGDWFLIERSTRDLHRILADAGFDPERVTISLESSGLAFIVRATRD